MSNHHHHHQSNRRRSSAARRRTLAPGTSVHHPVGMSMNMMNIHSMSPSNHNSNNGAIVGPPTLTPSSPFFDSEDSLFGDGSYSDEDEMYMNGNEVSDYHNYNSSNNNNNNNNNGNNNNGNTSEEDNGSNGSRRTDRGKNRYDDSDAEYFGMSRRKGPRTNRELVGAYATSPGALKPKSKAALKVQRAMDLNPDSDDSDEISPTDPQSGNQNGGPNGKPRNANDSDESKVSKPIRVREAISYVQLRQDRRKGWLALWGFMSFATLFIVMLNLWYDIATLARTQRAFARYFSEVEYDVAKGPHDVKTGGDVWNYLRAVVDRVYNNTEYGYTPNQTNRGHIMRYTKVLSHFTITKIGVEGIDCSPPDWAEGHHHIFQSSRCYKLPDSWFGTKVVGSPTLEFDLDDGRDQVIQQITTAETTDNFLDDATTEVKIQFWFYNPQTQYTIRVRAYFAFNVFGLVRYDGLRVFPIRLFPYVKEKDYFVAVCQGLYGLALIHFLIVEIKEMITAVKDAGGVALGMLAYWSSLWNVVDWITAALGLTGMLFHVFYITGGGRENLLKNKGSDFGLEWIPDLSRYTLGLASMFYSWKTLHYFDFEPRVAMLIKTLELAWPTLTFYAASLVVIMLGYAIGGYLIVGGTGLDEFATFAAAFQSCLRMTTGEISLETIWPNEAAHPATKFAVSIFYWTFVLLVFFILLNMFIAIILDSYTMQTQQAAGTSSSSASAHHKNLLLFFLDGVRVLKEYTLTKVFRRANGSIPKVCEDHTYVFLADLHNSGQVLVLPDDIRRELKDTPGGENMVNWLYHLQFPDDRFSFDPLVELGAKKPKKKDGGETDEESVESDDVNIEKTNTGQIAVRI